MSKGMLKRGRHCSRFCGVRVVEKFIVVKDLRKPMLGKMEIEKEGGDHADLVFVT